MPNIYKIINEDGRIYIGSTKKTIQQRFSNHKSAIKSNTNQCSLKDFNMDTARVELIEEVQCNNPICVKWKERLHMELNDCVNVNRPIVTEEERIQKAKENGIQWRTNCGNSNIECECGCTVQVREMARHKRTKKHLNFISENNISS